jgi:hypothetical protein
LFWERELCEVSRQVSLASEFLKRCFRRGSADPTKGRA